MNGLYLANLIPQTIVSLKNAAVTHRRYSLAVKRKFDPAEPELMDRPQPVSAELERDLGNLYQLNRFFGSHRLVRHFLRQWIAPDSRVRIADLATGSGDIPRLAVDYARSVGATVTLDAIDQNSATLQIARNLSAGYPEIAFIEANILEWRPVEPYDIVLCSLALHHFTSDDAVRLLQHCQELSRGKILVSDLRRGYLATVGVFLLTATVFREPMTRIDARLSAARAFSFSEFHSLADQAGWNRFGHAKFLFARQAIWLACSER
jgi:2-polyprenyl-3-methyl-5-hydroxy-6-metoxy-1,4-benzoquinol methylase